MAGSIRATPSCGQHWPGRYARDASRSTRPARCVARALSAVVAAARRATRWLLPSSAELARLAEHPPLWEDRLLILLIVWAGLRWTEAVSLSVTDVWRDHARLSVQRVLAWSPDNQTWDLEDVKGGIAATVPLPEPLWRALTALVASHSVGDRLGGDLLFRPLKLRRLSVPTMIIDHTDWSKRVWHPACAAADSGGTLYEAAALLRHADVMTTNRFYARAQDERPHDPARALLRIDTDLTLPQRVDALGRAWANAFPAGAGALAPYRPEPVAAPLGGFKTHEDAPRNRAVERKGPTRPR